MKKLYYGSKETWTINLMDSDGEEYTLPEGTKLLAIIKKDLLPNVETLFEQDITDNFTIDFDYLDYSKLKIGGQYWLEVVIVETETNEYYPPVYQEQVEIVGVAYGR